MEKGEQGAQAAMADRLAVIELFHRYAVAIDTRNWTAFRRLFTDDVVAEFDGNRAWTDLETWARDFEKSHAEMAGTQHVITNEIVDLDGDRAHAIFYGSVRFCMPKELANDRQAGVWYDDDLVRTPNGWRITRHTCRSIFRQDLHVSTIGDDPPWRVADRGDIRFFAMS
jgi:hypothetical protein